MADRDKTRQKTIGDLVIELNEAMLAAPWPGAPWPEDTVPREKEDELGVLCDGDSEEEDRKEESGQEEAKASDRRASIKD